MIFKSMLVSKLMQSLLDKVVVPFVGKEKQVKMYKIMVGSSQEEVDLHNAKVETRQVKRSTARLNKKLGK
jgi:hypothetical protein